MFSKNIILLLCVVGFKADDGPYWKISNPFLYTSTTKWKQIFNQYDSLKVGSISATELQKLLYEEFQVFLTIRQANEYTYLINLKKNYEIGLKQVKKMRPIIIILSLREDRKEDENSIENYNLSREVFVEKIASYFTELFLYKREVLEVLKVVVHNRYTLPIESKEYLKIINMLTASLRMTRIHKDYKSNGDPNVDFLQYISEHWMAKDNFSCSIPNLEYRHIININPNLNNMSPNKWKKIFNQYKSDNDGLISEMQLQKLLYEEFHVFLTIRNAMNFDLVTLGIVVNVAENEEQNSFPSLLDENDQSFKIDKKSASVTTGTPYNRSVVTDEIPEKELYLNGLPKDLLH
ncbi:uncharacterized protein LOC126842327 [Adelges cooleyi]|uniref:uncharacterized protein LOC126842327 n=1 Tax=Adelges cooleyi TaxID=133065 RepID=UPI00217FF349|nr:uncharacterized protein LOC126842327 [Adelges cooleyi]